MSASGPPRVQRYVDLAAQILKLSPSCGQTRLVAVDGPGGSGKSTFARRLSAALGGAPVVHTDDFASWDNQFEWWPRLLDQVIAPLSQSATGRYQRYDWVARTFAEWHDVPAAAAVVVEGVGAARREFAADLSAAIWVETPADLRLRRGIERDGEAMREFWAKWIDGETRHYAEHDTRERANLIVSGDPQGTLAAHDPETEFVALTATAFSPF
ncbi:MAG: uridine kinase family protein [Acidothermaceae bacterium]